MRKTRLSMSSLPKAGSVTHQIMQQMLADVAFTIDGTVSFPLSHTLSLFGDVVEADNPHRFYSLQARRRFDYPATMQQPLVHPVEAEQELCL